MGTTPVRLLGWVGIGALVLSACGSSHTSAISASSSTTVTTQAVAAADAAAATTMPSLVTTTIAGNHTKSAAPPTTARTVTPSPAASPTTTAAAAGTVVSSTNNPQYGAILVDAKGRTLYLFTPDDGTSTPQCTGSCAQTWPPLKASGTPHAQGGAKQSLLGVESGQVTYNGHPLYLYAGDSAAGQTNGEGVGAIWYVVSTAGDPVLH
jgi:predicted lipoprotein with Yx(FWY)xxD motif